MFGMNRVRGLLWGKREIEERIAEEVRFHVEMRTRDNVAAGMSADEARYDAERRFGNRTLVKEEARDMDLLRWLEVLGQDLRYSARMLRKSPGFTTVAVLSLALGIGANTAIFSLIDAVMLKMLPVKNPQQLFALAHAGSKDTQTGGNYPLYERYRDHNDVFTGFTAAIPDEFKISTANGVELALGQFATGNYHSLLGVPAILGRTLNHQDDRIRGGHPVAVISEGYWNRRYGRNPGVLGRSITLDGAPFTIIGVTAGEFYGLQPGLSMDITIPMAMKPALGDTHFLGAHDGWTSLEIIGRLRPGVSEQQAGAAIDVLYQQYMSESENAWITGQVRQDHWRKAVLLPVSNGLAELRKKFSRPLLALMCMVGVVLLIACANVANLLLARATARRREIAVRLAVGAGRWRLIRQLLTESLLLGVLGGALGLLFAFWGSRFLLSFLSNGRTPLVLSVEPDFRLLLFTASLSVLIAVLFGLAPAVRATRLDLTPALKENSRGKGSGRDRWAAGKLLVVSQIGLSLLLVAGAGLFVRSLQNLKNQDAGFHGKNVLLFTLDTRGAAFPKARLQSFYENLLTRLRTMPGVRSASYSMMSPLGTMAQIRALVVQGFVSRAEGDQSAWANVISPGYFETLGITLVRGRDIGPRDIAGAPKVAVINETMARHFYGRTDPIGRRLDIGNRAAGAQIEIVGVVRDAKQTNLRLEVPRMIYTPYLQSERLPGSLTAEVLTSGDPVALAAAAQAEVRSLSRDVVIDYVRTMSQQVDASLVQERLLAALSSFFGGLALLLACVGLYGTMAYGVARRSHEIGIRMALGAERRGVLWMVLRETLILAVIGVCVGVPAAIGLSRLVASFLFGLTATDPLVLAGSAILLIAIAVLAGYLPARRASRVDPMVALRYE